MNRRGLVSGLGTLFMCAPAIVRASSLMPLSIQPIQPRYISFYPIPDHLMLPMPSFEVEDPFDVYRVDEFVRQLKVVAGLIETHLEWP